MLPWLSVLRGAKRFGVAKGEAELAVGGVGAVMSKGDGPVGAADVEGRGEMALVDVLGGVGPCAFRRLGVDVFCFLGDGGDRKRFPLVMLLLVLTRRGGRARWARE